MSFYDDHRRPSTYLESGDATAALHQRRCFETAPAHSIEIRSPAQRDESRGCRPGDLGSAVLGSYRNDYALEAATKHPDRFAVMGKVPLNDPASKDKLATWLKQPGMLGFRISFRHAGTHSWLEDGTADWFWAAAEVHDIPVMIFAPFAVAKIGEIAERHPGLRVIVDHMGLNVQWKGKDLGPGVDVVLKFARFKNVGVKASCLPCYVDEPYPFPTLHPQIRRVVDAFGPQRIFWGTDLSQSPCSYRQNLTLFTEELRFLSASDKEWIMGRALSEWLRWPL